MKAGNVSFFQPMLPLTGLNPFPVCVFRLLGGVVYLCVWFYNGYKRDCNKQAKRVLFGNAMVYHVLNLCEQARH